ncbi:uncharacterized protein LOC127104505 [Lathyrus oleraceus]|uniref:uncharacterized protein LOC127104505 n=1 Tax=Pisum sativum TaxID=3888 RepID=UPI0021CE2B2A|nr:uncharacterized protein LOC127104505 [Pisum sativum]
MTVIDYVAKLEELSRFFPHYNEAETEMSKCFKFENGLHPEIKQFIGYQEIRQFSVLAYKCRIYDDENYARSSHYKSVSDKINGNLNHRKSYGAPCVKGKQRTSDEKNPNGGGAPNFIRCYKYSEFRHHISECKSTTANCFKCGKPGHRVLDCRGNIVTYCNCGEQGHISTNCQKPKKDQSRGNVFAFPGTQTTVQTS